jgi:hypothetical protein
MTRLLNLLLDVTEHMIEFLFHFWSNTNEEELNMLPLFNVSFSFKISLIKSLLLLILILILTFTLTLLVLFPEIYKSY